MTVIMGTVRDIMTKGVITINDKLTALDAAKLMSDKGISSLIVERNGDHIGIITERDFVNKICSKKLDITKINVEEIMSDIKISATPDTPIEVAVQRMVNHRIRRLPIKESDKVIGIITVTDLAKHLRTVLLIDSALDKSKNIN